MESILFGDIGFLKPEDILEALASIRPEHRKAHFEALFETLENRTLPLEMTGETSTGTYCLIKSLCNEVSSVVVAHRSSFDNPDNSKLSLITTLVFPFGRLKFQSLSSGTSLDSDAPIHGVIDAGLGRYTTVLNAHGLHRFYKVPEEKMHESFCQKLDISFDPAGQVACTLKKNADSSGLMIDW